MVYCGNLALHPTTPQRSKNCHLGVSQKNEGVHPEIRFQNPAYFTRKRMIYSKIYLGTAGLFQTKPFKRRGNHPQGLIMLKPVLDPQEWFMT